MPKPTGSIEFLAFDQPALLDGEYVLEVKQQVKIDGTYVWSNDAAPAAQLKFSVNGPRFSLDPNLIQSQFPPPKSIGEYYNILPHIILNRTTLPWERTIDNSAPGTNDKPTAWMALLLFDATVDKGTPIVTNLTVQNLIDTYSGSATPANAPEFVKILPRDPNGHAGPGELMLEIGQHPGDRLTVIDVPKQVLFDILPAAEEVAYLSHVRQAFDASGAKEKGEYPVILGNRLAAAGTGAGTPVGSQSTVHLVSLEARQPLFDELKTKPANNNLVRFVSLASWSFSTLQRNKTFTAWLKSAWCPELQGDNCAAGVVHTVRMPTSSDNVAEGFLAQGYAPIKHQTRQGNHLVSWYRGPCLPGQSLAANITLPVRTSDELVRYFSDVGMFDTTYAAAWELGRLLTLRSKKVSVSLFNWKRAYAQQLKQAGHAVTHLPFAPDHSNAPDFPREVSDWFTDLLSLKHVPFHYLVPREDMLPANSLRFFQVDVNWIDCLLDGAFSIGRVTSADVKQDAEAGKVPSAQVCSGFLLRSPVVSGWPNLEVEAYTQAIQGNDYLPAGVSPTKRLRFDRLGEDVLLCVFDGEIKTIDIHEHAETIHFGVDVVSDPSILANYTKKLRNKDNWKIGGPTDLSWRSPHRRTLNILDLKDKGNADNSAEFAVTMIEGVEKVRFIKSTT
ncbi:MAG TPA: hypothetical protein VFS90_08060 [Pyrinomonadaceae bacterium]|nr:hypothetical protein [Pyrinomonadaceae bacterium]